MSKSKDNSMWLKIGGLAGAVAICGLVVAVLQLSQSLADSKQQAIAQQTSDALNIQSQATIASLLDKQFQFQVALATAQAQGITPPIVEPTYLPSPTFQANATSVPVSGDQLAFVSERDGNKEIYVMNMDGTNLRRLTSNSATDESPSWSPDGTHIVFHSDRSGNRQIYVMNNDGSNVVRLTKDYKSDNSWPIWSPDGTSIIFANIDDYDNNGKFRTEVFSMNSDGTNIKRLTFNTGESDNYAHSAWPSGWSQDGNQILFYQYQNGLDQLWIMDSDGKGQRKLTNTYWDAIPFMSANGQWISFSSFRDGNYEIYRMELNGKNLVRLTKSTGEDWRPIWILNDTKILFESDRSGITQIYWMNSDGSEQECLICSGAYDGQPAWYP